MPPKIVLVIHWMGGIHTELRLPRRRRGQRNSHLARHHHGVTGHGNRWTRERATDGVEPWLNLTKAAALIDVSPKTLRLAAESGEIDANHPACFPTVRGSSAERFSPDQRPKAELSAQRTARKAPRDATPINKISFLPSHRQMGVGSTTSDPRG